MGGFSTFYENAVSFVSQHAGIFIICLSIYIGTISICTVRFAYKNEADQQDYDALDYMAMILLSPFFIVHKGVKWLYHNWTFVLFDRFPALLRWIFVNLINPVVKFIVTNTVRFVNWAFLWWKWICLTLYDWLDYYIFQTIHIVTRWFVRNLFEVLVRTVEWMEHMILWLVDFFEWLYIIFDALLDHIASNYIRPFFWWVVETLETIFITTFRYLRFIWNGIYDYFLYPTFIRPIYHVFYVVLWNTLLPLIWNAMCRLYDQVFAFCMITWNAFYRLFFDGRLLTALNRMYEGFYNLFFRLWF